MTGPRKKTIAEILLECEPRRPSPEERAEAKRGREEASRKIVLHWERLSATPEFKAWEKLENALVSLRADPEIAASPTCVDLIEVVQELMANAWPSHSIDRVVAPLGGHFAHERATRLAAAAHSKSKPAKEFVQREWIAHRDAYAGNKTAFSRDYVRRVWNEFSVKVSEKQMREKWLPSTPLA